MFVSLTFYGAACFLLSSRFFGDVVLKLLSRFLEVKGWVGNYDTICISSLVETKFSPGKLARLAIQPVNHLSAIKIFYNTSVL